MSAVAAARGLGISLGGRQVLTDIDVAIDAGEIVSVMGPSGSGKSTLLHCLAGILRPDRGDVWFAGQHLDRVRESQRSRIRLRQMGFVFQFGDLIPELTLLENVRLPLQLTGVRTNQAQDRAREVLDLLGVDHLRDARPATVSGGEAQRAAVARALVHQPAVIFADEPTGALDTLSGEAVMEALTSAARSHDAALLIVTHDLRVASYADRNLGVRDGRISSSSPALR